MTSDGLPEHELAACLAAGQHAAMCTPSAVVANHPQGAQAFLLPLIPATYINLAGPPSLESCTRDVYAPDTRFTWDAVLRLAHSIASAAQHLHERGLHHGDLYAHNILCTPDGHALLGDFGAAAFLDLNQHEIAQALQRLEVRAFGCLLEELLARADLTDAHTNPAHTAQLQTLQKLQATCMHETPAQRPLFVHITHTLAQLVAA